MLVRRFLIVIVTVGTVIVAGTSVIRTVRSFYQLDFGVTWEMSGLRVEEIHGASTGDLAGLKTGDLVTSVDGVPINAFKDPLFSISSGSEHLLTIRRPGEPDTTIIFRPPPPSLNHEYLARSAVGACGLACAAIAAFSTRRRETLPFLLLAASALLVAAIPHRTAATAVGLAVLHRASGAAMPFLLVRFFILFPNQNRKLGWWDAFTVLAMTGSGLTPIWHNLEAWWPATMTALRTLFGGGLLLGIVLQVRRWWFSARDVRERRQIEWAGLGLFVGLTPLFCLVIVPGWLGISFEPFSWLAILPIAAVPLGFFAALTEYRLWDLEPITRDLVLATLALSSGGFVFALTNRLLHTDTLDLGNLRNFIAFAAGVVLVVFLQPVRSRVEDFLDRWLYYGRPTPRWLLTHSTRDLATATDPRELLSRLAETLHDGFDIDPVATYLRYGEGAFRQVSPDRGDAPVVRIPPEVLDHPFPHPHESDLHSSGMTQRVRLERGGTVHGLIYIGLRRGAVPLGNEAQEAVSAFAAQAALGLENARRLDDLRRQAEEYRILHANTQRIIESSAAGILVCDAGGCILSANHRATEIFGLLARDLVGGRLEEQVVLPETWRPHLPIHAENAEGESLSQPPVRLVMAVSVLELDSGSFNGRVVVLQDVTELRDLQDRLREQERLAALGRLTAGLAHEINTPLTGISSYAQMLGEMISSDDPRSPLVAKLVDQSFRVSRIVANLRGMVRTGGAERVSLAIGPLAEQAASEAARSLDALDRLEFHIPDPAPFAWGSAGAVELAVVNLTRNAIEASQPGRKIEVAVASDDGRVMISVSDRGPGIPSPLRNRVFEAFFTTKTDGGGSGLGLGITRDMITQIGGKVLLEDRPGGGTRAIVELESCTPP